VLSDLGRLGEAEATDRESLAIRRNWYGEDHPDVAYSLRRLADVLRRERKPDEAETMYRQALVMFQRWFGNEHPSVATTLETLAELLRDQGKLAEAKLSARRCVSIREKKPRAIGERSPPAACSAARCWLRPIMPRRNLFYSPVTIPARSKPRLKEALERLVRLYEATNRPAKAAECRQKLAEFEPAETAKQPAPPPR